MLIDVRTLRDGQPCAILGLGHTILPEEYQFDNRRFIEQRLSDLGRVTLHNDLNPDDLWRTDGSLTDVELSDQDIALADAKIIATTGITSRMIFPGSPAELGTLAATACLADAKVSVDEVDAILVGTNTSDSYSLASDIKLRLGVPDRAFVSDVEVACPSSVAALHLGWMMVRSRCYRRVLVIGLDKASTLVAQPKDDYKSDTLFGDAAHAILLGPGEQENFIFFDIGSDPTDQKDGYIRKEERGFTQKGRAVHKYVGSAVPELLVQTFTQLNLDPATVHHFFPHQPSAKTIDVLLGALTKAWTEFRAEVHRNVEEMGNTSAACTGWMISRAMKAGQLQSGQFCLVTSFGAGMSWGSYGFIVP